MEWNHFSQFLSEQLLKGAHVSRRERLLSACLHRRFYEMLIALGLTQV